MPISWSTGAVLGPIIGGALSRPAEQFPDLFGNSEFLKEYPYFLPCAIPATFSAIAWVVTYLYLKETARNTTSIRSLLKRTPSSESTTKIGAPEDDKEKALPLRSLLIPKVVIAGGNYAMLSLLDISFRAIQPVFLSTPVELGGLALPPPTIGKILSAYGIINGLFQIFFFARINNTWGSRYTFIVGIASSFPVFACYPIMSHLVKTQGVGPMVWTVLAIQIFLSIIISLSYGTSPRTLFVSCTDSLPGAIFIYIAAASPNRASLGATNGICQMSVSVFRAIGPAAANSLFSMSLKENLMGGYFVYYVLIATTGVSLVVASLLPRAL